MYYDVLIATPGSSMEAEYVKSLMATTAALHERNLTYRFLNAQGSLVHNTRESTMTGSQQLNINDKGPLGDKVDYGKIFWIDSDISWDVKDFMRLLDSEREIVSGSYLLADGKTTTTHALDSNASYTKERILKMREVIPVHSVGFGFICMKKGVFEAIRRPWFELLPQQIGPGLTASLGEDISWCIKARQAGMTIYFDPKVLVNHMKTRKITWF